jgi:hypothetical protein
VTSIPVCSRLSFSFVRRYLESAPQGYDELHRSYASNGKAASLHSPSSARCPIPAP